MKKIFCLLGILLLISCNEGYEMNKIGPLISNITSSLTADDEEQALEEVWKYIFDNRIYIEILAIDQSGNMTDINEMDDLSNVVKVRVVFSKGENSNTLEWKPIAIDNVFILFRES
ncbi:hypothetical protein MNBD_GAMMA10-1532 [hydrothermal vent metagenome]|uniref:Uncharacterized protein n=1 Tax=hydrothermal vent metagenome TaxID=652676 RepID=A0A3B0YMC0_9ZZZZ